jgi:hypothetical protein
MKVLISVIAVAGGLIPLSPASAAAAEVGTCWNLTAGQRTALRLPAATPVDCDSEHTAELLAVVKGTGLTQASAFEQCQGLAVKYLANAPTDLDPSAYSLPRTAQLSVYIASSGKRADCVGFSTGARGGMVALGGSVSGTGLKPRVCLNSVTWAQQKCSAPKNVAMTNVAWVSTGPTQKYPGDAKMIKLARKGCVTVATSAGQLAQAWYVPGSAEWNIGNRYALCRLAKNETDAGWTIPE